MELSPLKRKRSNKEVIDILQSTKSKHPKIVARELGLTFEQVQYQRKKYRAYDDADVDRVIRTLTREIEQQLKDFERQDACDHLNARVFLTCECSLCLGETSAETIIEILKKQIQVQSKIIIEAKI